MQASEAGLLHTSAFVLTKRIFLDFWISDSSNPSTLLKSLFGHRLPCLVTLFSLLIDFSLISAVAGSLHGCLCEILKLWYCSIIVRHCSIIVRSCSRPCISLGLWQLLLYTFCAEPGTKTVVGREQARAWSSLLQKYHCFSLGIGVQCKIKGLGIRRLPGFKFWCEEHWEMYVIFRNIS